MLPKNRRIPRKLFPDLKKGKTFVSELFLARFAKANTQKSLFSFSVSKKVSKSAVVRNRIRRSGYHALEKHLPLFKDAILASFSFKSAPKNREQIEKEIYTIAKKSGVLK